MLPPSNPPQIGCARSAASPAAAFQDRRYPDVLHISQQQTNLRNSNILEHRVADGAEVPVLVLAVLHERPHSHKWSWKREGMRGVVNPPD